MGNEDAVLDTIETQIAYLMRLSEASRRATSITPHRALDRAAYVILRNLQESGPQNVSVLAERLKLDGSTVTRQVNTLQQDGLIERRRDPRDGRGTVISPTEAGLRQVDAVRAARRDLYDRMLDAWDADDRANLAEVLQRLAASMDDYVGQGVSRAA